MTISIKSLASVTLLTALTFMAAPTSANNEKAYDVAASTFGCINEMNAVRGFFVDNLNKADLEKTLKIANQGQGEYPPGSIVQLVPTEVMVKHPKGISPKTNDWEFFELAVSPEGSKFTVRGFEDVKNRFGGNCLDCHKKAKPEFDMICEQGHGCDPIPLTPAMLKVIQKTDPRCKTKPSLSADELKLFKAVATDVEIETPDSS